MLAGLRLSVVKMLWSSACKNATKIIKYFVHKYQYCTEAFGKRALIESHPMDDVEVLYLSEDFMFVNKPYDVFINNDDPTKTRSLARQLSIQYPELVIPRLKHAFYFPHRLDYATSGVICIALNKKACASAGSVFQCHGVTKFYLALVHGHVKHDIFGVRVPIGEDIRENGEDGNHRMIVTGPHCLDARSAFTRGLVLERGEYLSRPATKLLLQLFTGRRHQLRVHCVHLGHTIIGDYTYSNREDVLPPRMFLHAYRLRFPHNRQPLDIQTADPFTRECLQDTWIPTETVHPLDGKSMVALGRLSDIPWV